MDQRKLTLHAITALIACAGLVGGTLAARALVASHKEHLTLDHSAIVREAPTTFADIVSINKREKLTVIDKVDFTKNAKNYPTIIKLTEPLTIKDKETKQQFKLKENTYYKVLKKEKGELRIEATTNKGNNVQLTIPAKQALPLEDGVWKKVQDSKGNVGWVKI